MASSSLPQFFAALQFSLIADIIWFEVPQLVAWMAESNAVVHVIGQFRKLTNRLIVMGAEIAASITSAISASVIVSDEHSRTPYGIFRTPSQALISLRFPMRKSIVILSTQCVNYQRCTDFSAQFRGEFAATQRAFLSSPRPANSIFRFLAVFLSFKITWDSFSIYSRLNPSTKMTFCIQSVMPTSVNVESLFSVPLLADRASFLGKYFDFVRCEIHSGDIRGSFKGAFGGLRHG